MRMSAASGRNDGLQHRPRHADVGDVARYQGERNARGIVPRIAWHGIESSGRLGLRL